MLMMSRSRTTTDPKDQADRCRAIVEASISPALVAGGVGIQFPARGRAQPEGVRAAVDRRTCLE